MPKFPVDPQGKYAEAEPLYMRTQEIVEKSLGPDHPDVATIVSNRAELMKQQVRTENSRKFLVAMDRAFNRYF